MTRSFNQLTDAFETNQLEIEAQSPSRLIVKQRLKPWSYVFLILWSVLFAGIPTSLAVWVASEVGVSRLSCQGNDTRTDFPA